MTGSANRFKNIRPIPIPNLKTRDILKVRCRSRPALRSTTEPRPRLKHIPRSIPIFISKLKLEELNQNTNY